MWWYNPHLALLLNRFSTPIDTNKSLWLFNKLDDPGSQGLLGLLTGKDEYRAVKVTPTRTIRKSASAGGG